MTGVKRLSSTVAVAMLLLPLLTAISYETGIQIAPEASAQQAPTCQVGMPIDEWSIEQFNMTSVGDYGEDDDWGFGDNTGPEYMVQDLCPLRTTFSTSFVLYNDTAVGLRMHLTTGWKYTVSVDLQPLTEFDQDPIADVYLMQEDDYERYEWDYNSRHNEWGGMRDDIAHSSPWLQNLILWHPFRDVHSYEKLSQVDFAVALDHEERSYSIWETDAVGADPMFLMIESWDNIRDYDSKSQESNFSVDLTIQVEERFALPNWTVSMVCCGGLIGILAAPFLVHHRYMKAGLDVVESGGGDMMPHLDTAPEREMTPSVETEPPQG